MGFNDPKAFTNVHANRNGALRPPKPQIFFEIKMFLKGGYSLWNLTNQIW